MGLFGNKKKQTTKEEVALDPFKAFDNLPGQYAGLYSDGFFGVKIVPAPPSEIKEPCRCSCRTCVRAMPPGAVLTGETFVRRMTSGERAAKLTTRRSLISPQERVIERILPPEEKEIFVIGTDVELRLIAEDMQAIMAASVGRAPTAQEKLLMMQLEAVMNEILQSTPVLATTSAGDAEEQASVARKRYKTADSGRRCVCHCPGNVHVPEDSAVPVRVLLGLSTTGDATAAVGTLLFVVILRGSDLLSSGHPLRKSPRPKWAEGDVAITPGLVTLSFPALNTLPVSLLRMEDDMDICSRDLLNIIPPALGHDAERHQIAMEAVVNLPMDPPEHIPASHDEIAHLGSTILTADTAADMAGEMCIQCVEGFAAMQKIMVLPCEHVMHYACGILRLSKHNCCPTCYSCISNNPS